MSVSYFLHWRPERSEFYFIYSKMEQEVTLSLGRIVDNWTATPNDLHNLEKCCLKVSG